MSQADVLARVRKHRKWVLLLLALVLVYTLAGFFLAPWIAKRQIVRVVDDTLGLQAGIERLRINPYALSVRVNDLDLARTDGAPLLRFDELYVNFQMSSLFRWAWTFREIRLVNLRVEAVVHPDGSLNLMSLVPEPAPGEEPAPDDDDGGLPRLLVHTFELVAGAATFEDRSRPTPFRTDIEPVSFTLNRLTTLPEDEGEMALEAALESGARLTWHGTLGANPIRSAGRLTLTDGHMPMTKRYLQDTLHFHVSDGRSHGDLPYVLSLEGGELSATVTDGTLGIRDLVVTPEGDGTELLRMPALEITGLDLAWPQKTLAIDDIAVTGVRASAWRNADGSLNLTEHLAVGGKDTDGDGAAASAPTETDATPLADWRISVARLVVDDLSAGVEDRTVDPPFSTGIDDLDVEVRGIDNAPGSTFAFTIAAEVATGGALAADGTLGVLPVPTLDAQVQVDELSLTPVQPYLDALARLRIDSGAVSVDGTLTSGDDERMAYRGSVSLTDVGLHDLRKDQKLFGLGRMGADDLLFETTAARLRVAAVDLDRLYGRLSIYEDGSTNIGDVLAGNRSEADDPATADPPAGESAPRKDLPIAVEIGEIRLQDGSADFADLSLPLPFATRIDALEGRVSKMQTGGTAATVELGGKVDEYGLASIEGTLDVFAPDRATDVAVSFRNVDMSGLSPYSAKFAGYEIADGRLSLDLRYLIENRALQSENEILIERMTLGDKIDSPDAPKLPVKLAVALLKDKNGNIELDIPVGGTLDDPEFAYGTLVWKAVKNVMGKVATAPFRALAKLVGSDKDLEFVEFEAATSEIAPPARETLEELSRALAERPELVLEVRGVYDPGVDAAGIREQKLAALLARHRDAVPEDTGEEPMLASDRTRVAMESLFVERFGREELDALAAAHSAPVATDETAAEGEDAGTDEATAADVTPTTEPALDVPAYLDAVWARLEQSEPVNEEELVALAAARSAAIARYLTGQGAVPPAQLQQAASEAIPKKDAGGTWVRLRLVVKAE